MKGVATEFVFEHGRSRSLRNVGYSPQITRGSVTRDINLCSKIPKIQMVCNYRPFCAPTL
jgi:hypothetical protein